MVFRAVLIPFAILACNSQMQQFPGFREMIREAGRDLREVIPGSTNFMEKNGKNNELSAIEIYKNRLNV